MSYDISLHITVDTGGAQPVDACLADIGNYTANASPMWSDALGQHLGDLHDATAGGCLPASNKAVANMEADPAKYQAMNPANGWGDYEGALNYLRRLRDACAVNPNATIHISC